LFSLLAFLSGNGQKNSPVKDELTDQFVHYFNGQQYDSIFNLFSPEMKAALPLDKAVDFLSKMKKDADTIVKYEYIDKKQSYRRYRADFVKGLYWLSIAPNEKNNIAGFYFNEYDGPGEKPSMTRNKTKMTLPFTGEWIVFWGGDTKEQNYHIISRSQKNALDIMKMDEKEKTFRTNGKKNEDYYAFGQPLIAPCDAEVVTVIDGVKDNIPGEMNTDQVTGNTVVLKTAAVEYILFAHFKLNSIKVKVGDKVTRGQMLGLCGNSGNSSEPHLHFHIQDKENMIGSTGIKCYFDNLMVSGVLKSDYSPVRGDRIKSPQ
ncbi:MAG: peptidoglycan DD-metalloendopeptidase family protein, partial [Saprospiraceae bacterium]